VDELVEKYKNIYPKLSEKLEEETEESLACFYFPASHRRRIRTSNSLERLNEEIKKKLG